MFTSEQLPELRRKVRAQAALEARVLDELVEQAGSLAPLVRPALIAILGAEGSGWRTESRPRPDRPGSSQTWIHLTETAEFSD